MEIKRSPKISLSSQQADWVLRSASMWKSLIAKSDDMSELQGIKSNLTIKKFISNFSECSLKSADFSLRLCRGFSRQPQNYEQPEEFCDISNLHIKNFRLINFNGGLIW